MKTAAVIVAVMIWLAGCGSEVKSVPAMVPTFKVGECLTYKRNVTNFTPILRVIEAGRVAGETRRFGASSGSGVWAEMWMPSLRRWADPEMPYGAMELSGERDVYVVIPCPDGERP